MANMYNDILEFCVEQGVNLNADQIASAKEVFSEDAGVEDAAQKDIEKAADDPRSDDESQADAPIDASADGDDGKADPEDLEGEIDDAADHDFQNDADDQTKVEEAAQLFYSSLYEFCQENGVELTDSALQEMAEAGIFEDGSNDDSYASMLEFCVTNGVNLDADQIAALQEKFQ